MHPKNPYAVDHPDFVQLASEHPALGRCLVPAISNPTQLTIDFRDPEALRQLTLALLKRDFNLTLSLPENRLCPPVPARLDYCLWTIDLLKSSWSGDDGEFDDSGGGLLAIDIGTGASAIYALLLARLLPKFKCLATEIDPLSATSARLNISQNGLSDSITCLSASSASIFPLSSIVPLGPPRVAFTLCNPPFYGSRAEMDALSAKKLRTPLGTCTGAESEMVTPGGEEQFIGQMVIESRLIGDRVRWFTSLCGKYSSLAPTIALYKSLGGNNYAVTEFNQGHTNRWALGWSWQPQRASDEVARSLGKPGPRLKDSHKLVPLPNTIGYHLPRPIFREVDRARTCLLAALDNIEGLTYDVSVRGAGEGCVCEWNVSVEGQSWTRSARRKRKRTRLAENNSAGTGCVQDQGQKEGNTQVLVVKLSLLVVGSSGNSQVVEGESKNLKSWWIGQEIEDGDEEKRADEEIIGLDKPDDHQQQDHDKIEDHQECQGDEIGESLKIEIRWVNGSDRMGFEGFGNHVFKKVRVIGERDLESEAVV